MWRVRILSFRYNAFPQATDHSWTYRELVSSGARINKRLLHFKYLLGVELKLELIVNHSHQIFSLSCTILQKKSLFYEQ